MADKQAKLKVSVDVDDSSISKATSQVKSLQSTLNDSGKGLQGLTNNAKNTDKALKTLADRAKETQDEIAKADTELRNLFKTQESAPSGGGGSGGGLVDIAKQGQGGLSKLGGAASALGGGGAVSALGNVAGAVEGVQQLGTTLASLGPLGIAAGIGLAAAGLALGEVARQAEEQRKALEASANALRETNQTIAAGATSNDISQNINELTAKRNAEAATLDTLNGKYSLSLIHI